MSGWATVHSMVMSQLPTSYVQACQLRQSLQVVPCAVPQRGAAAHAELPQRGRQGRQHAQRVLLEALPPHDVQHLQPAAPPQQLRHATPVQKRHISTALQQDVEPALLLSSHGRLAIAGECTQQIT